MTANRKSYKKIALILSLCLIVVWALLGAGTSLAWFTDTSPTVKNIFHVAEFDLAVSYRTADGTYRPIDGQTNVFDDQALYEPGYVQVVYLKVENTGSVPFDFKTAVNVTDYTLAVNVFGQTFNLQDHLLFGLVTETDEALLQQKLAEREAAVAAATQPLNTYSTAVARLGAGQSVYMALIVRMPETVANEANYRGETVPRVELGIIVSATQTAD